MVVLADLEAHVAKEGSTLSKRATPGGMNASRPVLMQLAARKVRSQPSEQIHKPWRRAGNTEKLTKRSHWG